MSATPPASLLLWLAAATLALTQSAFGDCSAPAVSIAYSGPDASGHGTANVTYSFTSNDGLLTLFLDGSSVDSSSPSIGSGTWSRPLNATCLATGSHTLRVDATGCASTTSASTAISVNTTPTISASYAGPDAEGHGTATINYHFPNTDDSSQRFVSMWVHGQQTNTLNAAAQDGTWSFALDATCWATGSHQLDAFVTSCQQWTNAPTSNFKAYAGNTVQVNTTPTLASTITPPDVLGHGSITLTYSFPNTASSVQRSLSIWRNGSQIAYTEALTSSGTWTVPVTTTCLRRGTYDYLAIATACQHWNESAYVATQPFSFTVESRPQISVVFDGPDSNGSGLARVTYAFQNTDSPDQRPLSLWLHGQQIAAANPTSPSGEWDVPLSTICWPDGNDQIDAFATACSVWNDPDYKVTASAPIVVDHHPKILDAALLLPMAATSVDLTLGYSFPQTPASERTITLSWMPGKTQAASTIVTERPANNDGTKTYTINRQPHDEFIKVTLSACSTDETTRTIFIPKLETDCCCGATSCQGDPIHVGSANMRYTDREPLPGDFSGAFARTYDSNNEETGVFGARWSTPFDAWLQTSGNTVVIATSSNARAVFQQQGSVYVQIWPTGGATLGTLTASTGAFEYRAAGGDLTERYVDGQLVTLRHLSTNTSAQIAYDTAGLPLTVTDGDGAWQWNVTASATTRRVTAISVAGRPDIVWHYNYDDGGTLLSVTAPDGGTWRAYEYMNGLLTAARDPLGHLIESHDYSASGQAATSTGPGGDITAVAYDLPGRVAHETATRVTSAAGKISTYYIRYVGGRARTVQIDGGCSSCGNDDVTYGYDSAGHLVLEQDSRGYLMHRTWDSTGTRLIESSGPWQPGGCDPATDPLHCRLDPDSILTVLPVSTAATVTTSYAYGDAYWPDKPTSITTSSVMGGGKTRSETFSFDPATGMTLAHSATGWTSATASETHTTTRTLYDGTQSAAFNPCGSSSCVFASSWLTLPQPAGRLASTDGPRSDVSDVTRYVYYPIDNSVTAVLRGRLAAVQNAAGHVVRYESYDVFGNADRVVDANGVATTATFDALGRPLTTVIKGVAGCDTAADPLCAIDLTTTRTYAPPSGPLAMQTDAGGNVTAYEYDARGRVTATSRGASMSSLAERMELTYDPASGHKSMERYLAMENGAWIEKRREMFAYDSFSRLISQSHPDTTSVGYLYDSAGAVASVRDENHSDPNTRYVYDSAGRLATVRQTLGGSQITTAYTYDIAGNLAAVIDPNGNATTYVYDDFSRMQSQTSPVTGTTTYGYDPAGNLISTTDANGAVTARTYDALGRMLTCGATLGGSTETITWAYDTSAAFGKGRLASMTDSAGSVAYAYDRRGLLLSESRTSGPVLLATSFRYDAVGNRTAMTYPSGLSVAYSYDHAARPLSLSANGVTYVSGATYLPFGPETSLTFANGTAQTRSYDARYRIQRNTLTGPAGAIADYTYSEDPAGNIAAIHDMIDAAYNRDFGYDDLNRLVTANSGASLWGAGSYTYDVMGNLLQRHLGGTVEVDPNDPLLRRTGRLTAHSDSLPAPGSIHETFAYSGTTSKLATVTTTDGLDHPITCDAAGNETRYYDARTYSARNLMASIAEPSEDNRPHTINYTYDGRGVRLIRSEGTTGYAAPFASRYYVYSPELQLLAISVDDNPNVWGKTAISNMVPSMKHEILWFNGRPIAERLDGSTIRYTFTDHLGTPVLQTDSAATVTWRAEYEPYGDLWTLRAGTTAAEQPLRFPGQEYERKWEGVEERYNIFRWYRSGWGRYTQADPISFRDNATVPVARLRRGRAVDLYAYVTARPINLTDPLGLWGIAPPDANINTITCDGSGGITPQIVNKNPKRFKCVGDCTREHEESHAEDALAAAPDICKGQPRGVIVGFTSDQERVASEHKAFYRSLECLGRLLAGSGLGCCTDEIEAEIQFLTDYGTSQGYLP